MSTLNGHAPYPASATEAFPGEAIHFLSPVEFTHYQPEETIEDFSGNEQYGSNHHTGNRYAPHGLDDLERRLVESFERYVSENNEDEDLAEILPALIPIIAAVAPAVVQGVTSLISNASRRRAPQRQAPPRPATHNRQPRPQRAPATRQAPISQRTPPPQARPQAGTGAASAGATSAALSSEPLNQFLSLLSHPAVTNLIQQAIRSANPASESIVLGKEQIEVSLASVLNAVSESARKASEQMEGESGTEIPEYLLDTEGNFLCDVSSPGERAEVLLSLIQEDLAAD